MNDGENDDGNGDDGGDLKININVWQIMLLWFL